MKKLLTILFLLVFAAARGQYPIIQNLGSDSTLIRIGPNYNGAIKGGIIPMAFTDTTAANLTRIKDYAAALIWTTSDSSLWARQKNGGIQFWFKIGGAGGGSTGSFWNLTGNFMAAIPSGFGIGTNSTDNLPFKTDGTTRVILPSTGLARQAGGAWRSMMFDTTNLTWGYGDGINIYNSDGTLTGTRTVTTGGNALRFSTNATNFIEYDAPNEQLEIILEDGDFKTSADFNAGSGVYIHSRRTDLYSSGAGGLLTAYNDGSNVELNIGNNIIGLQNGTGTINSTNNLYSLWATENPYIGVAIDSANGTLIGKGVAVNQYSRIRGLRVLPNWQIYMDSIDAGGTASDSVLVIQADGKVVRRNAADFGSSSVALSAITAATADNIIDNTTNKQTWRWDGLDGDAGLYIESTTTAAAGNNQELFKVNLGGTNATSNQTTYAATIRNNHFGTSSTNIGLRVQALNGTNNYALWAQQGSVRAGSVGNETGKFEIIGTTSGVIGITAANAAGTYTLTLPTTDGNSGEFLQTDGSGVLTWAAASGGSPAGNFGNLQINRNGALATPASDSLDFESATGLTVKGGIRGTTLGVNTTAPTATYAAEIASDGTYTTNLKLSNASTPTSFLTLNSVYGDVLSVGSLFKGSEFLISQSDGIFGISQGANQIARFTAADGMYAGRRWQEKQGADIASANNLTLGGDGNVFEITGTTQINLIANTNWQNGAEITLLFTSNPTVKNAQATSGSNITIVLAGGADFVASANDALNLRLVEIGGVQMWLEMGRSVN